MSSIARRGLALVLVAPSGAGKSSIARALLAADPAIAPSLSATTRPPRPGELEGVHYRFLDEAGFDALLASGGLLEWARVFGHRYGTPARPVHEALAAGRDMLFDIDWQGARALRAALPGEVVQVAILPPSLAELERRLVGRSQDPPERIAARMARARDEIAHWRDAEHVIVNDDFATALTDVAAILRAARLSRARQVGLEGFVDALVR